jgi:hypothetical protein
MTNGYACIYCGYDGGFHGCRLEAKHTIERYLCDADVLDADELTNLIGALGYWHVDA